MLVLEDIITYPYLYHNWLLHKVIVFLSVNTYFVGLNFWFGSSNMQ